MLAPCQIIETKAESMRALRQYLSSAPLARGLAVPAALGILAVAVVHLIDGTQSLGEHSYVGALELLLVAACVPLAVLLAARPVRLFWHAAGALCTAALLVYVLSRTTGLPGSTDDIGNWLQTLGVLNVILESAVIAIAATVVRTAHSAPGVGHGPAIEGRLRSGNGSAAPGQWPHTPTASCPRPPVAGRRRRLALWRRPLLPSGRL